MGVNGQENQIEYSEPVTYNHCFGYLVLFRLRRSVHIPSLSFPAVFVTPSLLYSQLVIRLDWLISGGFADITWGEFIAGQCKGKPAQNLLLIRNGGTRPPTM